MGSTDQINVLVNDLPLYTAGGGIATYLRELLAHWPDDSPVKPRGYITHVRRKKTQWPSERPCEQLLTLTPLSRLRPARGPRGGIRRLLRSAASAIHEPLLRRAAKRFDVAFEPNTRYSMQGRRLITTIHDLTLLECPQWHPPDRVGHFQSRLQRTLDATDHFIAVSHHTKSRLESLLHVDPSRITVAHHGPRPMPLPDALELESLTRAAGLPSRHLLHVGTIEPRKNIIQLLDALALLDPELRRNCPLILAGGMGWGDASFFESLRRHEIADSVYTTGRASVEHLGLLLAGATATLQPSHEEGFGLPVLESLAAGRPTICSDIDVFHEVGGGAARYITCDDTAAWAREIETAIQSTDPEDLQATRRVHAATFTWEASVATHARVFAGEC